MAQFLALGRRLAGDDAAAMVHLEAARVLARTEYWGRHFASFGLDGVLDSFPRDPFETAARLAAERERVRRLWECDQQGRRVGALLAS